MLLINKAVQKTAVKPRKKEFQAISVCVYFGALDMFRNPKSVIPWVGLINK